MPGKTTIHYLEPRFDLDGKVLYFLSRSSDRRHPPKFISPEDVPDPKAGAGYFECERVRRGPWIRLVPIRRSPGPG